MACVLIYSAQQILAPFILALTEPNTPTIRVIALEFLEVKRKKPPLSHWYITVVSCLPWANCLAQLRIIPLNYQGLSPGHSTAGVLQGRTSKNCQQCHAKKLRGDSTLFGAWKFHSASQSFDVQMPAPKSCNAVMYWHRNI